MNVDIHVLIIIGVGILAGFLVGKFLRRIKLPAVVGYIVTGVILGPSLFHVFNSDMLKELEILTSIALAVIAFIIGGELKLRELRSLGTSIIVIILSIAAGSIVVVTTGVYLLTGKMHLALILAALSAASAPAGTAAVLQEYKSKGPLTTALYSIVGVDDGLAIIIYAFAVAAAKYSLQGAANGELINVLKGPIIEIGGSLFLGCVLGLATGSLIRRIKSENDVMAVFFGIILMCSGIALQLHFSVILSNLVLGMTFANFFPSNIDRTEHAVEYVRVPLYVLFFVLAGAHLKLGMLPQMGILGIVYFSCRIIGKAGGAYIGGTVSHAKEPVRKYAGLGIMSQAGVAIGLALSATHTFANVQGVNADFTHIVMNTITATTIVFEILGPIGTKIAITRAGEIPES